MEKTSTVPNIQREREPETIEDGMHTFVRRLENKIMHICIDVCVCNAAYAYSCSFCLLFWCDAHSIDRLGAADCVKQLNC